MHAPRLSLRLRRRPRIIRHAASRISRVASRVGGLAVAGLVVVGSAATSATVTAPTADAVINGAITGPAPWAVQITTFHNLPGTPCSGVVIHPHWVATAGHCGPADPNAYTLGFGNRAPLPGGLAETAIFATPGLVGAFGSLDTGLIGRHTPAAVYHAPAGDFMLLKLRHPAPAPAVLRAGADPTPGSVLQFHGFGSTGPLAHHPRATELRTGQTRLDRMVPRDGTWVGQNHTLGGGFSFGDSGGPIFHGDRLVGVHNRSDHGRRQPDGSSPAHYQSIPAQNGWIDWMIANR